MKHLEIFEDADFKKCVNFHGHICGGLAMGVMAAKIALNWSCEGRAKDEELVAIVENDACGVDAIQVLTGCTFGKGNLIFKDYGKMAFTFFNRNTGKGIRVVAKPKKNNINEKQNELFRKISDNTASDKEKESVNQIKIEKAFKVLNTPFEDLFNIKPVMTSIPQKARIEPSVNCMYCGESTMRSKLEKVNDKMVCRGCLE